MDVAIINGKAVSPSNRGDADKLVAKSWKDVQKNKSVSVPGMQYKILALMAQYAPRPLVRKIGINVRRKQR